MKHTGYRAINEREINLNNLVKDIFELLTAYDIEASDNEVKKLVLNYIDSGRDVEHASAEDVIELDLDNEPDSVLKYNGGIHYWIKEGRYNEYFDESTTMNESFLSPGELKKKLQRVAARWASINGVKFEESYNELRKKKSVKDMLDFYSVDEIIDDLKKHKKEVDDELEEEI